MRKFGTGEGIGIYFRMIRQFAPLGGLIGQRIDGALKRRPTIVAGEPDDPESFRVAEELKLVWNDIPERVTALKKFLMGVFVGFAALERVWQRHEGTGVVAPMRLIDRPQQNFIFLADGTAKFLTLDNPFIGEPIDPMKFMFLRGGSEHTAYGEGELKDVYLTLWKIQQIEGFLLEALEKQGRPIPHYRVPRNYDPKDKAALAAAAKAMYGAYVMTPTDATDVSVEFPALNIAAAGAAGRSESEILRLYWGQVYIRLLRVQQTQDKTGGSRALEDTRMAITDLATLPDAELLCDALNQGWLWPTCEINYPSLPADLRPRFVPDPTAHENLDTVHKWIMDGLDHGVSFSAEAYFKVFPRVARAKDAADELGHARERISDTTNSPIQDNAPNPADQPPDIQPATPSGPPAPGQKGWVGVVTTTGQTLYFDPTMDVLTSNRGAVPFNKLTHGDEPVTVKPQEKE